MPVAFLVGILVASILVNVALIVLVARADDLALRGPRLLRSIAELLRSSSPVPSEPPPRRRALYVAEPQPRAVMSAPPPVQVVAAPGAGRAAASGPRPMTETLPADLAEFLSHPAEIAIQPDAPGRPPGEGLALLARWPKRVERDAFERDGITGLEGPGSWGRILEVENARLLRYRRPVTVVMAEIEGLARLVERMGEEPVGRLLPVVADALVREARSSDWVARIGEARFAALLPETDEIQAINYVERVRAVCEPWLSSAAVQLRLAIGWSGPTASSDLAFALRRAEERMNADRRPPGRPTAPANVVPGAFVTLASRTGDGDGRETVEAGAVAAAGAAQPSDGPPAGEAVETARSGRRRRGGAGKG